MPRGAASPRPSRFLRSPSEFAGRLRQKLSAALERAGITPRPTLPADGALHPSLPFPLLPDAVARTVYESRPAERDAVLGQADGILEGRFDLLGYARLEFGSPVDWHLDPVSGRRAPLHHWSRVRYLDHDVVGDHKVIWELNRQQFLPVLAVAWRLTGDDRYPARIAGLLDGWLEANPPGLGINWASSLEVAFRSIAWTWTLHLLGPGILPRDLTERVVASLGLHGRHVERYLSTWFSPNTHLTGEALALLYLGRAFPGLPPADRWLRRGWDILMTQLPIQVRPDGTYFEQSSWYQGYTVDFYLHALRLAAGTALATPPGTRERVRAAATVLRWLARGDGTIPVIGDDDGGRLLPLGPRPPTGFGDTLALAAAALEDPDLALPGPVPAASLWLTGEEGWRALETASRRLPEGARRFEDGGWHLLRHGTGTEELHLIVDAGPHGSLSGAHAHADALSFGLSVGGRPVLSDPGTCVYHGADRAAFAATRVHNTLTLGGESSAERLGQWRWGRFPDTEVLGWRTGDQHLWFRGRHDGYGRLVPGLVVWRDLFWVDGMGILLIDRVEGDPGPLAPEVRFHAAPGLDVRAGGDHVLLTSGHEPVLRIVADAAGDFSLEAAEASTCYGTRQPTSLVVRRVGTASSGVGTLLSTSATEATLTRATVDGLTGWRWRAGRSECFVRTDREGLTWTPLTPDLADRLPARSFSGVDG